MRETQSISGARYLRAKSKRKHQHQPSWHGRLSRLLTAAAVAVPLLIGLTPGSSAEAASVHTLSTTFEYNNNANHGAMFDVTNLSDSQTVTLTGHFESHFDATNQSTTMQLWYRQGSVEGNDKEQEGWSLLGEVSLIPDTNRYWFDIGQSLTIDPGQTLGLFFYSTDVFIRHQWKAGDDWSNAHKYEDEFLSLGGGYGKSKDTSGTPPVGGISSVPRIWNGTVEYMVGQPIPLPSAAVAGLAMFGLLSLRRSRRAAVG